MLAKRLGGILTNGACSAVSETAGAFSLGVASGDVRMFSVMKRVTQRRRSRGRIIQLKQTHYEPKPDGYTPLPLSLMSSGYIRRIIKTRSSEAQDLASRIDWERYKCEATGVRWHPVGGWRVQFDRRDYEHNFFVKVDMYFRVAIHGFDRAKELAIGYRRRLEAEWTSSCGFGLMFLDERRDLGNGNGLSKERYAALREAIYKLSDGRKGVVVQRTIRGSDMYAAFGMHEEEGEIHDHSEYGCPIKLVPTESCELAKDMDPDFCESILQEPAWNVHQLALEDWQQIGTLLYMFEKPFDLISRYNMEADKLATWLKAIKCRYLDKNPYHNWLHALEVTQSLRYAVVTGGGDLLNKQDILALYCAGIAHDVGHIGVSNPFLEKNSHELALLYNDKSPMENLHAFIFFETMLREGHTFLEADGGNQWKNFRRKVIAAILSTDMANHFSFVDKFTARVTKQDLNPFREDCTTLKEKNNVSKEDRMLLLEAFMHTADLTHNFKPFNIHKIGLVQLEAEWFLQGDEERSRGIPISANNDRHKDSAVGLQSFFLGSMVRPLLSCFRSVVKEDYADQIILNLDTNKKCWEKAIAVHGKKTVHELVKVLPDNWSEITLTEISQAAEDKERNADEASP